MAGSLPCPPAGAGDVVAARGRLLGLDAGFGYRLGVAEVLRKILVVDDSRTQLEWLVAVLQREGYDVRAASGGKEALLKVRGDPPDLVLLDMILPDMDGLEVLRFIKARPDDQFIPVIILSVKSDLDSKVTGLRIGQRWCMFSKRALNSLPLHYTALNRTATKAILLIPLMNSPKKH